MNGHILPEIFMWPMARQNNEILKNYHVIEYLYELVLGRIKCPVQAVEEMEDDWCFRAFKTTTFLYGYYPPTLLKERAFVMFPCDAL